MPRLSPLMLMAGNSHPQLLHDVASHLHKKPCEITACKFANGETRVSIGKSVRDADVFLLQTGMGHKAEEGEELKQDTTLNDSCMELLIMASGVRLASAQRIVAVLPYFPYSKQSKQKRRGTIPARLFADLLKTAGVEHVITLDLHHMQMQGFFSVPIDNVKSSPLLIDYIREHIPDWQNCVVVSKNAGALKRAALIAKRLGLQLAMITGEQYKYAEALSEERLSGEGSMDAATREQTNMMEEVEDEAQGDGIIGSVNGRGAIIIDDIIDTPNAFISAAKLLKNNGAKDVYVIATHGLLSGDAPEELNKSGDIKHVVVTNTVPQQDHVRRCEKLEVIDCSFVLAEAIRRVHNNEPLFSMYTNHKDGDKGLALTQWKTPEEAVSLNETPRPRSRTRSLRRAATLPTTSSASNSPRGSSSTLTPMPEVSPLRTSEDAHHGPSSSSPSSSSSSAAKTTKPSASTEATGTTNANTATSSPKAKH
ncbi:phosphoribosyl pyrophosphate synthetase-associated protein 1 [Salpingoeca rosetta]|uniref:ribose-phosphate diphosphokinase n=1 Tax=Salpingoeca rosetta (strain ATCC 50818 / BSB-021) TaxID=946362 RepID=F2UN48_SALR5|nr:phosphoribosyl pyrophosphate synthetase-associated protein 1 [Salpingoeca rosetta]EGD78547.1 phosphoribosyl pyrophosphate synthetase-associated protein 1 [Salpingoeca rosetta]|eukprot:XP_004989496.1 phosphoribosyl pyrophosphate synthetase-associated protein 1 [Salpingoeca rosetta]